MAASNNPCAAFAARLTAIAAEFSGYAEADLAADKTFLELGFDSLFLTQLATAYQKDFGTPITFRQLITDHPTISALAAHLGATVPNAITPPAPAQAEPEQSEPAVEAARAPSAPVVSAPLSPEAASGMEALFARQLQLMREQLQVLRHRTSEAAPAKATSAAPAPKPVAAKNQEKAAAPIVKDEKPKLSMPEGFGPQLGDDARDITPSQRTHIDRLIARYNAKTVGSKERTQAERAHHADPRTAAGFNPLWKEMVYPLVVTRSKGAHLWDVDGNQYIDILNGFGPNFFGHRAPFITEALKAQLGDGFEIGPQTPLAGEAAKLLCELTGMDRVSWVNTGSEAVQAAMRISRTITGRDKIVVFKGDYHGNFDEVLVRGVTSPSGVRRTMPLAPGIPFASLENIIVLDYGETSALEAIAQDAGDIAAVLVEPVQSRRPEFQPKEFLHKLRKLTEKEGIVLVFDEVITGFRSCPGGAQEYFGVKADLATYGKVIGGGMPVGVVAGRAKFMDTFDGGQWRYGDASKPEAGVTFFAGTFVRHPLAIAAVHASLAYLKEQGPALQERVSKLAARMADGMNAVFDERSVKFEVVRFTSQMFIRNNEENELATLFFYHLRDRGVHVLEGFPCYMTAAHDEADVDAIIAATREAVLEMQADGVLPTRAGVSEATGAARRKLPLTPGQRILWSTSQLSERASCAFNESDAIYIDGDLDIAAFKNSVDDAIAGHEAFSLRFDSAGEYQWIAHEPGVSLARIDLSGETAEDRQAAMDAELKRQALSPFDLENGPLLRALLFTLDAKQHVFVVYAHHIVFDGYSADILIRDIVRRYRAELSGTAPARAKIAPYSEYVAKLAGAPAIPDYWRGQYADGGPALLELPGDHPRPEKLSYKGATARRALPAPLTKTLRETARSLGVSMSALTLGAYSTLLARLSGRENMVVGLPAAGQAFAGVETVGYCVNVLPLRLKPAAETTFVEFAKAVQETTFDAFENQNLSLSALIRELGSSREAGRLPLIETVFNFAGYFAGLDAPGVKFSARENRRYASCYDLFFNLADAGEELIIDLDYASDIFDASTIDRWIELYAALLGAIVKDPQQTIGALADANDLGGNVVAFAGKPRAKQANADPIESAPVETGALSETEQAVVEAAAAVFGVDEVPIDGNFYEVGGHSIHASRLLTRLRRSTTPALGIRAIFECETFRELAGHIDHLSESKDGDEEREEFLF